MYRKVSYCFLVLCCIMISFFCTSTLKSFAMATPFLQTTKTVYSTGEAIPIYFYNGPGNPSDWIGIYRDGDPDRNYLDWMYVNNTQAPFQGYKNGMVTLKGRLEPGTYNLRFFANNGYVKISPDIKITVTQEKGNLSPDCPINIMTMNTWNSGQNVNDGINKIINAITMSSADIVGFQEISDQVKIVSERLGWHYYKNIISRYPIVEEFETTGAGARVRLPSGQEVLVVSTHLDASKYGPYEALFERKSVSTLIQQENTIRGIGVTAILNKIQPYLASNMPVFLVGDFNAPSHLDWTQSTQDLHDGYIIEWPVSKKIEQAGMLDSYRTKYPNPVVNPGNTWSPVFTRTHPYDPRYPYEPQDRIDFIYTKGRVQVLNSQEFLVGTPKEYGQHQFNEWPSDHRAVVSQFLLNP